MRLPSKGNSRYKDPEAESHLKNTKKNKVVIRVEWDDIRKAILSASTLLFVRQKTIGRFCRREVYSILIVSVWLVCSKQNEVAKGGRKGTGQEALEVIQDLDNGSFGLRRGQWRCGKCLYVKCFEAEPIGFARRLMWDVRAIQVSHDSKALVLNWG